MANGFRFFGAHKLLIKKANLNHPYGLNNENHALGQGYLDTTLQQGTPEWDTLDHSLKSTHGNMGLHDMAEAYHVPKMPKQRLNISPGASNPQQTFVNYEGSYPGPNRFGAAKNFNLSANHQINNAGQHVVNWDYLANHTDDKTALGRFIKQVAPVYQKAGVHSIQTSAYGESDKTNGQHSWSSLGFDFALPHERESTRENALAAIHQHANGDPKLLDQARTATHPFHFQNIASQLAHRENTGLNSKQHFNMMLKRPDSDSDPNHGSYEARLKIDPQDAGYQHLQKFLTRFNR